MAHVTSVHRVLDSRIFYKECSTLRDAGYQVTLIAPADAACTIEGIELRAVRVPTTRWRRIAVTVPAVFIEALKTHADVYHLHDPELIFIGILLKTLGRRVIYDAHEDLPQQIYTKAWIPTVMRRLASWIAQTLQQSCGSLFDSIVAATPTIASTFRVPHVTVIQNFPTSTFIGSAKAVPYEQRPHTVLYIGGISRERGAVHMVESISAVLHSHTARLALAGEFASEGLRSELRGLAGWSRTTFLGWLDRQSVVTLLSQSRIGLLVLAPVRSYCDSYPIKLFEYMAAGLPVIASDFPLWRSIVGEHRCGLLVNPESVTEIASAIDYLLAHPEDARDMGLRGAKAVRELYNWNVEGRKLELLYASLASDHRPTRRNGAPPRCKPLVHH